MTPRIEELTKEQRQVIDSYTVSTSPAQATAILSRLAAIGRELDKEWADYFC